MIFTISFTKIGVLFLQIKEDELLKFHIHQVFKITYHKFNAGKERGKDMCKEQSAF